MGVDSWPADGPAVHRAEGAGGSRRPRADEATTRGFRRPAGGSPDGRSLPDSARPRPAAGAARHRPATPSGARPASRSPGTRSRTPGCGPLGDTRGLTAAGALVILLAFGLVGSVVDRLLGHGLWIFFSVGFLAAVLLNAIRIHLEDLAASIVLVPIAYAVTGAVPNLVASLGSGSALKQEAASAAGVLVLGAPLLLLAVAVATVIAIARGRSATRARQRARSRAARRFGIRPPGTRQRRVSRPGVEPRRRS